MLGFSSFSTVSLSLFSANASPNITADVVFNVTVGEANKLTLATDDLDGDTVNVVLESMLPDGATFENNVYTWTPTSMDVVNISYVLCMTLTKQKTFWLLFTVTSEITDN